MIYHLSATCLLTFDLSAASLVDLMSVEGVTREAAEAIQRGVPCSPRGRWRVWHLSW
jgi:hypothetical protein